LHEDYGSSVYFAYDDSFLYVLGVFIDDEPFGARGEDGFTNFLNDGFEIFIDALNGFPGPYSAYVFHKIGCEGILRLLKGVDDRKAKFDSAVGYCDRRGVQVFEGVVEGYITDEMLGESGFGYDPIFKASDCPKTFAQDPAHKNLVSHRRRAIEGLCRYLSTR